MNVKASSLYNDTQFDSRYKFTAKELDNEANYTYTSTGSVRRFGAGNPLILVDPDGRSFDHFTIDTEGKLAQYINILLCFIYKHARCIF
jgi:hypothetical protein